MSSPVTPATHRRRGNAVGAWGLEVQCRDPAAHSNALTAVVMPEGHDADRFREAVLERFDMSLGAGLGKLKGRVFRIGHLGSFNDLMLAATLSGVEMGLAAARVPHRAGGVQAALDSLSRSNGNGGEPIAVAPRASDAPARSHDAVVGKRFQ